MITWMLSPLSISVNILFPPHSNFIRFLFIFGIYSKLLWLHFNIYNDSFKSGRKTNLLLLQCNYYNFLFSLGIVYKLLLSHYNYNKSLFSSGKKFNLLLLQKSNSRQSFSIGIYIIWLYWQEKIYSFSLNCGSSYI